MPQLKGLTIKSILIDSVITIVISVIQVYSIFALMIYTYGFLICGEEYLSLWNNIRLGFVITILVFITQILITIKISKYGTVIIKVSFWIITLSTLLPLFYLSKDLINYTKYYEKFDSKKWKSSDEKPLSMIRIFYEKNTLIGKSKQNTIDILGEGNSPWYSNEKNIGYDTDGYATFVVIFKNDTVKNYNLLCND